MVPYKQNYCSGSYYPIHYRSGDSKSMIMTDAWQTQLFSGNNVLLYGTSMTIK